MLGSHKQDYKKYEIPGQISHLSYLLQPQCLRSCEKTHKFLQVLCKYAPTLFQDFPRH